MENNRFNTNMSSNQNKPIQFSGGGPPSIPAQTSQIVGPRLMSGGPGPIPGSSQDNLEHSFGPDINSGRSSYKHHNQPYKNDGGQFNNDVKSQSQTQNQLGRFSFQNHLDNSSSLLDSFQGTSGPQQINIQQQYVQDAEGDIIGEENKLEDNFNQLQLNLPKSSNMNHEQYSQSLGGPVSGQIGSNFGKMNVVYRPSPIEQTKVIDTFNVQMKNHEKVNEYNKIGQINNFESGNSFIQNQMNDPYEEEESSLIEDEEQQINSLSKPKPQKSSQIDTVIQALSQYSAAQLQQLFIMHYDCNKQNKLILTEAQFTLVKQIYLRAFQGNRWSMSEDQQQKQMFLNCKHIYEKVILKKQKK